MQSQVLRLALQDGILVELVHLSDDENLTGSCYLRIKPFKSIFPSKSSSIKNNIFSPWIIQLSKEPTSKLIKYTGQDSYLIDVSVDTMQGFVYLRTISDSGLSSVLTLKFIDFPVTSLTSLPKIFNILFQLEPFSK